MITRLTVNIRFFYQQSLCILNKEEKSSSNHLSIRAHSAIGLTSTYLFVYLYRDQRDFPISVRFLSRESEFLAVVLHYVWLKSINFEILHLKMTMSLVSQLLYLRRCLSLSIHHWPFLRYLQLVKHLWKISTIQTW